MDFTHFTIDEKIIDLTERATRLWCGKGTTEAAGLVFYGWNPQLNGFSVAVFQAHFIIYSSENNSREKIRVEDSIVESHSFDEVLNLLDNFLMLKESVADDIQRKLLCWERREIVESTGFAD